MNIIYSDGGTKGSRICMYDKQKEKCVIKTRGNSERKLTNNELEYLALLYCIEYCNNVYSKKKVKIKVVKNNNNNNTNTATNVVNNKDNGLVIPSEDWVSLDKRIFPSWINETFIYIY